jgi:hypothetical protein
MRVRQRCKCGAEFEGRGFWGPSLQALLDAWAKFEKTHARTCLGVVKYETRDDGVAVITTDADADPDR